MKSTSPISVPALLVLALLFVVVSAVQPSRPAMAEGLFEELPMIETTIRNGDKLSTMRIKCEIEVPDLETARAVGARRSKIIDGFVAHIDTLRITDLQGPDNLHRLRALFTEIANAAVAPLRVDGVLFKEMLVK